MTSAKLLPCPFCGGEQSFTLEGEDGWVHSEHSCDFIECESFPTEAEAIEAWNTRSAGTCRMEYSGGTPEFASLDTWTCSECGYDMYDIAEPNYCPNCGAKVVDE